MFIKVWKRTFEISHNVSVCLMFAKIPLKSISFWQIWVEVRYTLLADVFLFFCFLEENLFKKIFKFLFRFGRRTERIKR